MKITTLLLLMLAIAMPCSGSQVFLYGAHQENLLWQGDYLTISGVPILSTSDARELANDSGLVLEVTVTPAPVNDSNGKITYPTVNKYVVGANVPADYASRTLESGQAKTFAVITSDQVPRLTAALLTSTGGNAAVYLLTGRKWTQANPQITMSLTNDANFTKTGLTTTGALGAITSAGNTWDDATNRNLFSDSGANLTTASANHYDHINAMSFVPYTAGSTALAATGVWYKTQGVPAGQMYPLLESDITFNLNDNWTTTGESGKLDFQSVALHEMGHTIGLGDLYDNANFSTQTRQVMHYYTGIKRTLGNGDAAGVWMLYH